mgnify:CR=1 FL=1
MESYKSSDFKNQALAVLSGKWKPSVVVSLVALLIICVIAGFARVNSFIYLILYFGVAIPVMIGLLYSFYDLLRNRKTPEVSDLFVPFQQFKRMFVCYILVYVYTFLWTLLLIVPGIIKGLSYSMTFYILKDRPELTPSQAIDESIRMMEGHKADLFILILSFIGWAILATITVIGLIWFIPYVYTANAAFYEKLKADKGTISLATE